MFKKSQQKISKKIRNVKKSLGTFSLEMCLLEKSWHLISTGPLEFMNSFFKNRFSDISKNASSNKGSKSYLPYIFKKASLLLITKFNKHFQKGSWTLSHKETVNFIGFLNIFFHNYKQCYSTHFHGSTLFNLSERTFQFTSFHCLKIDFS